MDVVMRGLQLANLDKGIWERVCLELHAPSS